MVILTVSGPGGSGKSTIAVELAHILGAQRIYVGGIRREIARSKGMTIQELNEYALDHPETDVDVDEEAASRARRLVKLGKVVLVEGRTQFHFLPESLKLYITVDTNEAAKRIWGDLVSSEGQTKRNEKRPKSVAALAKDIRKRDLNDAKRYKKYYGFDHRRLSHYDYVIDTTYLNKEEAISAVISLVVDLV